MPGFTPNRLRGLGLKLKIAGSVSAPLFGLAGGFAGGPLGVAIGGTLAALIYASGEITDYVADNMPPTTCP